MSDFAGFPPPTKNFFSLPNEMINIIARIDNMAELKVIIYVIRHTWGYQEYGITKAITIPEFMTGRKRQDGTRIDNGTGLKSDRSVKDGIKAAIKRGYLICEIDDTDKARIKKSYALKMLSGEGYNLPPDAGQVDATPLIDENRQVVSTPLTGSIYPSEVQHLPLGGATSTPRSEKDTLERHSRKTPEERQESVGSGEPDAAPASLPENVSSFAAKKAESDARLKAYRPSQASNPFADMTAADMRPAQGDGTDSTLRMTAMTPARVVAQQQQQGGTNANNRLDSDSNQRGNPDRPHHPQSEDRPPEGTPLVPSQQTAPTFAADGPAHVLASPSPLEPGASGAGKRNGKGKGQGVTQPPLKTPDELAIDALCSRLYTALTSEQGGMRGYAWDTKGAIISERTNIRRFVEKYYPAHNDGTFALFQQIYTRLATKHFKWSKPSFVHKITAYVVFDEAQSELLQMKDEALKPTGTDGPPATRRPRNPLPAPPPEWEEQYRASGGY